MNLYIVNHKFHYELENLTRLFYPNEKINVIKDNSDYIEPCIITGLDESLTVSVNIDGYKKTLKASLADDNENERMMCEMLYKLLCEKTFVTPPWGLVTGVRPIKLYRSLLKKGGEVYADKYFAEKLFVEEDKINLAKLTERNESKILSLSGENSLSLYIAIPFCPSRCKYCSFVQSSVERSGHLIETYVELLLKELEYTAKIVNELGLKLETVYMGGGTPTTLSASQLSEVLNTVNSCFDMSNCKEFTVEAGRPDTITKEKLISIKENKVNRISINPQTLNDDVLSVIGRKHTTQQTLNAFALARETGFDCINMDLIAGLPSESFGSFKDSLERICDLSPECITIHTLSMKRSATLTQDGTQINKEDAERTRNMLSFADEKLKSESYSPYYLYRQSRMLGNLENTGWSKKGFESLYNIFVMDETHTIIGCGAGAVTKLKDPYSGYLERIFNFKYPYEYISRFEELLNRKSEIYSFYRKCLKSR